MKVEIIPVPMGFDTCYVLRGDGVVAVDAGQPGKVGAFRRGLRRTGIEPRDVGLILLTHGHWDHVGSARDMREMTGAPIALHRSEIRWVERGGRGTPLPPGVTTWGRTFIALHGLFMPLISVPATTVDIALEDTDRSLAEFGIAGTIVHTPGHTTGSVSVVLDQGDALVGDLAMNKLPLTWSPSLPIFAEDVQAVLQSWRKILPRGIRTIHPAHGPAFPAALMRQAVEAQ